MHFILNKRKKNSKRSASSFELGTNLKANGLIVYCLGTNLKTNRLLLLLLFDGKSKQIIVYCLGVNLKANCLIIVYIYDSGLIIPFATTNKKRIKPFGSE